MPTRRFELIDKTSRKFWEVTVRGAETSVRFGRLGTEGQTKTKTHDSAKAAQAEVAKLILEKTGKGYSEVLGAAAKDSKESGTKAPGKPSSAGRAAKASANWFSYEHPNQAWAHFRLKGLELELAQGQPGSAKEWSEDFDTAAEGQARWERVVAQLEGAKYALVAETVAKPPEVLGKPLSKMVEEVELDEELAAGAAKDAILWRKFYAQSEKALRPSTGTVDGGALAARWLACAESLRDRGPVELEWTIGDPASAKDIAETEKVLGIKLPPSLRSFLKAHDGAEIVIDHPTVKCETFFAICGTKDLQETYLGIREWPEVLEGELMKHLRPIGPFFGSHMIALDTRVVSSSGEYAVVSFESGWTPRDYTRLAPDFGTFLGTMIDDFFMIEREHPKKRFVAVKKALQKIAASKRAAE